MPMTGWSEEYSVGDPVLDSDHRVLTALLHQLHDALDTGQSGDVIASVFNVLAEYAEHHFQREEEVLERIGFPDRAAHGALHRDLGRQVADLRGQWLAGDRAGLDQSVPDLLKKWLTEHIQGADKAYRPWIDAAAGL